ncbi:UDP-glycosyltransferase 87A1-like isoform X2 [Glycine soja]|uniref:UDP-glycosyltransferase 87A1-like isoform X2 n=1 Tax=Glycine soja TaxID=3848 RepID=UPI0010395C75|nr:UDP-glycosyltransferase 87A1-like isoform X2 [Glycine soja]
MDDCIQVLPITASHVVAVPYPGRGHVNPMMNLCKLLLSKNSDILVSFVVTEEWLGFIGSEPKPDNIGFATIPNVIPSEHGRASDFVGFFESVMTKMEAPFEELLHRLQPLPTLIIYDTYLFWVVRVANSRNIPVASFWPMSASVFAVFKHYHLLQQNGHYPVNVSDGEKRVDYIPGNSSIRLADFPLNDENWRSRKLLELALNVIPWVQKAQYLLFPSIYELEPQAIDALKSELSIPIYTVGPVIPYFGNGHIDFSNFADHELGYFQWLENQPSGSVLYISQGSFLSVSNEQIDEIAAGVRESGVRFLWVQRGENDRLKDICGDKGLILQWCDQLRVLQHHAIGGFWSHCGWNSTREGVFSGVPFLTFPIFMDQPLNGKLIVEEWKVGWRVRTKVKEDTLITKDEIASLIRKFMHLGSDEVRDMRKRSRELKQLCHGAIASGGSSETNINDFLSHVLQSAKPEL